MTAPDETEGWDVGGCVTGSSMRLSSPRGVTGRTAEPGSSTRL